MNNFTEKANLIWGIADLLRGEYKQADYGKVILRDHPDSCVPRRLCEGGEGRG